MPSRNRLLIAAGLLLVLAMLVVFFAPLLVTTGIKTWIWWKTRGTGIRVTVKTIEAPFLRPIVLRNIRLQTLPEAPVRIEAAVSQATINLDLKGILLRTRGRPLRRMIAEGARLEIHRNKPDRALSENDWNTVQRLLPVNFQLEPFELRIEDGATLVLIRGAKLSGSAIEAGRVEAAEVVISSPLFRQTFSNLRGATDWQNDRLRLAGLTLTRGLDVLSITTDLSHIGKRRVGFEFDLDAFGGKLRGSVASEWRSQRSTWNIAGSANDISLSQTAEAFGFTGRVAGLLHAGKFTFRGDIAEALTGTASVWVELTGPAWLDREADVIMLGLSWYGRQLQLQQLYVKQKKNQLTLNGEGSFPSRPEGWLRPDFRGNVSASIEDLGDFATLLGSDRKDFAGHITVEGTVDARDRNFGGHLTASGFGLTMFKSSIDEFHADLNLKKDEIEVAQLELKRNNDLLHAQGRVDRSPAHAYSGVVDATVENISEYLSMFTGQPYAPAVSATLQATVTSNVWEAWAVFDPPESKPLNVSATFPLQLGQPLGKLWGSSISLTIDAPELNLAEIPHQASATPLQRGILSTQLTLTDTPTHPRITGYAELRNGVISSNTFEARIRFGQTTGTIESFQVGETLNGASFAGEIDLADTQNLIARLFPNQPLADLTSPVFDCFNKVELAPAQAPSSAPKIGEVQVWGDLSRGDWYLTLKDVPENRALAFTPWDFASRTFRLCSSRSAEVPLVLGIQPIPPPQTPPQPARPRKPRP